MGTDEPGGYGYGPSIANNHGSGVSGGNLPAQSEGKVAKTRVFTWLDNFAPLVFLGIPLPPVVFSKS